MNMLTFFLSLACLTWAVVEITGQNETDHQNVTMHWNSSGNHSDWNLNQPGMDNQSFWNHTTVSPWDPYNQNWTDPSSNHTDSGYNPFDMNFSMPAGFGDGGSMPPCSQIEEVLQMLQNMIEMLRQQFSSIPEIGEKVILESEKNLGMLQRHHRMFCTSNSDFREMTVEEAYMVLMQPEIDLDVVRNILKVDTGLQTETLKSLLTRLIQQHIAMDPTRAPIIQELFTGYIKKHGGIKRITIDDVEFMNSSFVNLVPVQDISRMPDSLFHHLLSLFYHEALKFIRYEMASSGHRPHESGRPSGPENYNGSYNGSNGWMGHNNYNGSYNGSNGWMGLGIYNGSYNGSNGWMGQDNYNGSNGWMGQEHHNGSNERLGPMGPGHNNNENGGRPNPSLDINHGALLPYMLMYDPARLRAICSRAFSRRISARLNSSVSLHLIICAPVRSCKQFPADLVQTNLNYLRNLPWGCGTPQEVKEDPNVMKLISHAEEYLPSAPVCGRYMAQKAIEPGYDTSVQLDTVEGVMNMSSLMFCLPDENMMAATDVVGCQMAMEGVQSGMFNQKVTKHVVSQCIELPSDLSSLDCTTIADRFTPILTKMKLSFYKQLSPAVLCDPVCVSVFKNISDMPDYVSKFLMRECFVSAEGNISREMVQQMGGMVTELPVAQFESISAADLAQNLDEIKQTFAATKGKKRASKKVVMREIAKKMKESGNIASVMDSREIMKQVSLKDLKSSVTNIEEDLGLNEANKTIELTDSQNRWVMKKILEEKQSVEFSAEEIRSKKSLVKGFLSTDIQRMGQDNRMDKAVAMCEQSNWPLRPLHAINRDLIVGGLSARSSTSFMAALTSADVAALGCECLMHFKYDELAGMQPDVCSSVCQKVGHCNRFRCLSLGHRQHFTLACLKCQNVLGTTLTDATLDGLGPNLLTQLTKKQVSTMISGDVLTYSLQYIPNMCMPMDFRKAYATRITAVIGSSGSSYTWDVLELLQNGLMLLDPSLMAQIDKPNIVSIASSLVSLLMPTDEEQISLQECCEKWLTSEDLTHLKQQKQNLMLAIKDAVVDSIQNSRRRRRRDAVSWTCEQVQLIQEAFTLVSDEEINIMANDEFIDCLPDISQFTTWTSDQKTVLLNKTVSALGAEVCNMTDVQVQGLGVISQAIPPENISCLQLDVVDTVVSLGSLSGWQSDQLSALSVAYMTDNGLSDLASVTSSDIVALGSILCGYNGSTIANISVSVMAGSGAQIGELSDCGLEQMTAFKTLAMDDGAYGPVSNWTAADTSELKFVVAGVSGSEVASLSLGAIEGLSADVIPRTPQDVLKMMSVSQLESFSEAQSLAVTEDQLSVMTQEQRTVISLEEGPGEPGQPSIGSSLQAVILVVIIAAIVSAF